MFDSIAHDQEQVVPLGEMAHHQLHANVVQEVIPRLQTCFFLMLTLGCRATIVRKGCLDWIKPATRCDSTDPDELAVLLREETEVDENRQSLGGLWLLARRLREPLRPRQQLGGGAVYVLLVSGVVRLNAIARSPVLFNDKLVFC